MTSIGLGTSDAIVVKRPNGQPTIQLLGASWRPDHSWALYVQAGPGDTFDWDLKYHIEPLGVNRTQAGQNGAGNVDHLTGGYWLNTPNAGGLKGPNRIFDIHIETDGGLASNTIQLDTTQNDVAVTEDVVLYDWPMDDLSTEPVRVDIYAPVTSGPAKAPVILLHGGAGTSSPGDEEENKPSFEQAATLLAQHGHTAFSVHLPVSRKNAAGDIVAQCEIPAEWQPVYDDLTKITPITAPNVAGALSDVQWRSHICQIAALDIVLAWYEANRATYPTGDFAPFLWGRSFGAITAAAYAYMLPYLHLHPSTYPGLPAPRLVSGVEMHSGTYIPAQQIYAAPVPDQRTAEQIAVVDFFSAALTSGSVPGHTAPLDVPLYMATGDQDVVIPPEQQAGIRDMLNATGGDVTRNLLGGYGHGLEWTMTPATTMDRSICDELLAWMSVRSATYP